MSNIIQIEHFAGEKEKMNRQKCTLWLCAGVLIICAALLILSVFPSSTDSSFTRKVESDSFSLGMERLNDTLWETFYLQTGDTIDVDVVHISGELCISIGQKNQEPVYEGNNPELNHFQVNITNSGDYTISVTGKQAEGSISFHILRNEE